ncbi:MAG: hypothetical protein LBR66_01615 [Candidatus Symbiothrix sp.]|jgi:hypothetical protein|nr:hypothetical protein [Candidatus Symbiothrix sp.]
MKLKNLFQSDTRTGGDPFARDADEACCGQHAVCLKDRLQQAVTQEIIYYDDEELDAFRYRAADTYTDDEIAQFEEVLHTMLPEDVTGWLCSLQMRGIELPDALKSEVILLIDN